MAARLGNAEAIVAESCLKTSSSPTPPVRRFLYALRAADYGSCEHPDV